MNYISNEKFETLRSGKVQPNDILFCLRGSLGKSARIKSYYKGAIASSLVIVRTNDICSPSYLHYYLNGESVRRAIVKSNNGSSQPNLSVKSLTQYDVPLPSLPEQESIVKELDLLSGIIEKKKQQLKELDNLAQSIFYEMFGDPITNEKGWDVKKMKEIAPQTPYKGCVPIVNGKSWTLNLDMVVANTGDVIDKLYIPQDEIGNSTCAFGEDYVLYSKLRPYLNKVVLPDESGYCTTELVPLLPDKTLLDRVFLAHLLRKKTFVEYISIRVAGAKMPRVSMNEFRSFNVILPPLPLQQSFAQKIEAIEKQKELIKQSIKETETLFNSRMDYYFN